MTNEELLSLHDELTAKARGIMVMKNHDYAGNPNNLDYDPFRNFRMAEVLGLCTTEAGMAVRLSDKLQRLCNFLRQRELKVKDERVEDTVVDAINYLVLIVALLRDKDEINEIWTPREGV